MHALGISLIVFICIFGGALLGFFLHKILPEPHLSPESRQVVNLGMGVIGTMSALVLGLLVASAKGTYDAQSNEVLDVSGKVMFLDQMLQDYGPESQAARTQLRVTIEGAVNRIWPKERTAHVQLESQDSTKLLREIQQLAPKDEAQRTMKSQAVSTAMSLLQTRSLAVAQQGISTSIPLLVILIFWFVINFISLGLYAPQNGTVMATLLLCALAVSGAIFLILELSNPLGGLFRVSSGPLRVALAHLGH
jgi:hypothetical protein